MITDALLAFSNAQDLTALAADTATPSTNTIDFSVPTDFGPVEDFKVFAEFSALPTGPAGATLAVSIQVSADNSTWVTLEQFPATDITTFVGDTVFAVRAKPAFANAPYRYMRLSYLASAVLTGGTITAGIAAQVPARHAYPRNFVA